ncbi:pyridoxamine 5'-phosphate oxidase family protein [Streptomyces daliensis]|uniref:Pyridoxamine 5'-phosphate oxidase family protein n=1 Tax=Streptomyces daliensis TaxID=299421 RepID=A0A8T4ISV1_9ACTN|nr:pyridoxamine 5'-phosphate oxidase family protein [Streptomyces daliensis]
MQRTIGTERLADHIAGRYVAAELDADAQEIVRAADCFYLATVDASGAPDCSYKGGLPGFVRIPEPGVLLFPSYDGNGMFRSLGNILENPRVGMLFIDYEKPIKLRVNGDARVSTDPVLLDAFHEADAVVQVDIREAFENCPRYLHDVRRAGHSKYIPQPGHVPPDPDWKLKTEYDGLVRRGAR